MPQQLRSDSTLRFDRAQIFATGALTLADLLARVGTATGFSAGYVSAPAPFNVAGDFRRTRVFIDGLEYAPLDARANGMVDLTQIPLWAMEDATIERTAVETRVHLRTWRVTRTTPYTRTDIGTGDQQLNLYRGYFAKRYGNGAALQFAAQQYGTTPPSYLGSSADQLGIIGRVGIARPSFSLDAFFTRIGRHRGDIRAFGRIDSIPGVESSRHDSYIRIGVHDPDTSATWAQAMAGSAFYNFKLLTGTTSSTTSIATLTPTTAADTLRRDTTRTQRQYLVSGGVNRGPLRLALGLTVRRTDSLTLKTPSLAGSYARGELLVRGSVEGRGMDSLSRADLAGEFAVRTGLRLGVALDRIVDHRDSAGGLATRGVRAWAGVEIGSVWVDAGLIHRDSTTLYAPTAVGTFGTMAGKPATGLTLHVVGRVWHSLYADVSALRWGDTAGLYRPRYQTRSELFVRTSLPQRFPKGNFGFLASLRHEYRSSSLMPVDSLPITASGEREVTALLEIRIYTAVVSWQIRNVVGTRNYQAADYLRPRTTNFYGVRWEFWN